LNASYFSPFLGDFMVQHGRLAHADEHKKKSQIRTENLNAPPLHGVGNQCAWVGCVIEKEISHARVAPITVCCAFGDRDSVGLGFTACSVIEHPVRGIEIAGTVVDLICREISITDPGSNDQHAHGLDVDEDSGDHEEIDRAELVPMPCWCAIIALLPHTIHIPVRELHDVGHECHHDGDLKPMKELDETPVDVRCRNSKNRSNEDRPASAADDGGDRCEKCTNSDEEVGVGCIARGVGGPCGPRGGGGSLCRCLLLPVAASVAVGAVTLRDSHEGRF